LTLYPSFPILTLYPPINSVNVGKSAILLQVLEKFQNQSEIEQSTKMQKRRCRNGGCAVAGVAADGDAEIEVVQSPKIQKRRRNDEEDDAETRCRNGVAVNEMQKRVAGRRRCRNDEEDDEVNDAETMQKQ